MSVIASENKISTSVYENSDKNMEETLESEEDLVGIEKEWNLSRLIEN